MKDAIRASPENLAHRRLLGGWSSLLRTILRRKFPVKQGNNREVCSFQSIFAALEPDNAAETLGFFIKFPGKKNRELFFMIKEISKGDQGILGVAQGSYMVSEARSAHRGRSTDAAYTLWRR